MTCGKRTCVAAGQLSNTWELPYYCGPGSWRCPYLWDHSCFGSSGFFLHSGRKHKVVGYLTDLKCTTTGPALPLPKPSCACWCQPTTVTVSALRSKGPSTNVPSRSRILVSTPTKTKVGWCGRSLTAISHPSFWNCLPPSLALYGKG